MAHKWIGFFILSVLFIVCNGQWNETKQVEDIDGPYSVLAVEDGMVPSYYNLLQYIFLAIQDIVRVAAKHMNKFCSAMEAVIESTTKAVSGPELTILRSIGRIVGQISYAAGSLGDNLPIVGERVSWRLHRLSNCSIYVTQNFKKSIAVDLNSCFLNPSAQFGELITEILDGTDCVMKVASEQFNSIYRCQNVSCTISNLGNTGCNIALEAVKSFLKIISGGAFFAFATGFLIPCVTSNVPMSIASNVINLGGQMMDCCAGRNF